MIFEAILSALTDEPLEDLGTMRKMIKREFAEYKKVIISQHSKEDKQIYLEKSLRDFATLYHEATRYFAITFRSLSEATKDIEANGSRKYLDATNAKYLVETELLRIFYEWLCDLIAELKIYPSKEFIKECEINKNWKRLTHEINLLFDTGSICEPLPDEPADIVTPMLLPPKDEANTANGMSCPPPSTGASAGEASALAEIEPADISLPVESWVKARDILNKATRAGYFTATPQKYVWKATNLPANVLAYLCLCLYYEGTDTDVKNIAKPLDDGTGDAFARYFDNVPKLATAIKNTKTALARKKELSRHQLSIKNLFA